MFDQVKALVHTSADDCKISLQHCRDINILNEALAACVAHDYKSKAKHISSRIKQIERAA